MGVLGERGGGRTARAGLDAVVALRRSDSISVPMFYRQCVPQGWCSSLLGSFTMGNCMDSGEGYSGELPLHTVYVSAFYMDRYEVTKALWDEVKGWNGGQRVQFRERGCGEGGESSGADDELV